jgi:hypothetical protein
VAAASASARAAWRRVSMAKWRGGGARDWRKLLAAA